MVFGSFRGLENAQNWAAKLSASFGQPIDVEPFERDEQVWYRVQTRNLPEAQYVALQRRAEVAGLQYWRVIADPPNTAAPAAAADYNAASGATTETPAGRLTEAPPRVTPPLGSARLVPPSPVRADNANTTTADNTRSHLQWDLGLQTRTFTERGAFGQQRFEASVSGQLEFFRSWDNDQQSITVKPFLRIDSADAERTHADFRELFYSRIGDNWDLHIGAKRVFWGVTEFHHLIDIINQTDLIENIDTEDRLGQPMVQLSLVRNWGILDIYALTGFRERTFAGSGGRLRGPLPILDDGEFESAAEQRRVDGAIRWSHHIGAFEFGVHHFSGTSRDPLLIPEFTDQGPALRPFYPVIDQTGIDAQGLFGDWALKFEGFSRSGFGDRYAAFNIGFERTLVGVFNTRADLGVVVEYLFDERGDDAVNTPFERDLALGGRLALNDFADTQALLGVIVDTQTEEYFVSLEASRRLSNSWSLSIEGRVFGGGEDINFDTLLTDLLDPDHRSASVQRDDYLQIEIRKFL